MWKKALIAATVFTVTGSALVYAQQPPAGGEGRWRPSAEDMGAFADARIAALKAGLRLTPDQDKLWPPLDQAMRDLAKLRIARMSAPRGPAADPIEALQHRADRIAEGGAVLKRVAEAAAPLYRSLDEGQRQRFRVLGGHILHTAMGARMHGHMRGPKGGMGGRMGMNDGRDGWHGPMGPGGRGDGDRRDRRRSGEDRRGDDFSGEL